jgi:Mg/Co/Ni transporter MgtE
MSAQFGFAFHKGLAAGEADKASAVAEATRTGLITGLILGALGVIAVIGWFRLCGALGAAIGEALAGDDP